jgi:hypothetical protein
VQQAGVRCNSDPTADNALGSLSEGHGVDLGCNPSMMTLKSRHFRIMRIKGTYFPFVTAFALPAPAECVAPGPGMNSLPIELV